MKSVFKFLAQSVITLSLCVIIGELLLFAVFHVPINEEYKSEADKLLYEQNTSADYPLIHAWEQYFTSYRPGVFDGGSTTLIAIYTYRTVTDHFFMNSLMPEHSRYWHGYIVLWRPLLYFLQYKDLEILCSFVLFFVAMLVAAEIRKRKTLLHTVFFCIYFMLTMPMIVGMCLQYIPIALITYLGLLFYIHNIDKLTGKSNAFFIFFLIIGALTNYFDLLTYPLCTWGIIIVWALLLDPVYRKPFQHIYRVVLSGISWIIGYGGMWVGKAIFVRIFIGKTDADIIFNEMRYRSGSTDAFWNRLNAMYVNWRHYMYPLYAGMLIVCVLIWIIPVLLKGWRSSEKRFGLGLIMISSPIWYFILGNHTRIHHLFTYRIYGVMIMAALGLMIESMPRAIERVKKPSTRLIVGLVICLIPAILLTLITYEETEISNKECPYPSCNEYVVDSLDMEMEFIPAQRRVTEIAISFASESTEGKCILDVIDGDRVIYEENLEINPLYYYMLNPVNWTLEKGHTYKLRLKSVDNDLPIHYYQFDGDMTLNDIGPGTVNGVETGNESLFGVAYYFRPYSRARKMFMLITYYVFSLLIYYIFSVKSIKTDKE